MACCRSLQQACHEKGKADGCQQMDDDVGHMIIDYTFPLANKMIQGKGGDRDYSGITETGFGKLCKGIKTKILKIQIFIINKSRVIIQNKWGIEGIAVTYGNKKQQEAEQQV